MELNHLNENESGQTGDYFMAILAVQLYSERNTNAIWMFIWYLVSTKPKVTAYLEVNYSFYSWFIIEWAKELSKSNGQQMALKGKESQQVNLSLLHTILDQGGWQTD